MKLRSIPLQTCITLARERKLISVARDWHKSSRNTSPINMPGKRGRMRQQISSKPFEEKLSQLEDELSELSQFAIEGFDVSKLQAVLESQIKNLLQFLGRINE